MIDLDAPGDADAPRAGPPAGDAGRRWRRLVVPLALLIVGVLLGGAVMYRWQTQRLTAAERAAIVLLAAPVSGSTSTEPVTVMMAWNSTLVELSVHVAVVNVSSTPLTVRMLSVDEAGLTLSGTLGDRWIRPGEASSFKVPLRVDCEAGYPIGVLRANLSVETDDGARRMQTRSVTFDGSSWNHRVESACPRPR